MLQLFPSRQIAWYMAKLFLTRTFAVLIMLVLILQTLDLLGESGKILAVSTNDQGDILSYITMRVPQLIARFLPYAVLLATLITFSGLSQHSEVVSMKAAGLSAHQILAPMLLASLVIAGGHFVFNDLIVAPSTAKLKRWQDVKYGAIPNDSGTKINVWVREGQDLINAATVSGVGAGTSGASGGTASRGGRRRGAAARRRARRRRRTLAGCTGRGSWRRCRRRACSGPAPTRARARPRRST